MVKDKVEVIKKSSFIVHGAEKIKEFIIPHVLRLVKLIRAIYKSRVPFSKRNVFIRDNFTCQYCGSHENPTVDHVMPISRGGKSEFDNCTTACKKCNNHKNNKTPGEAKMFLKRLPHHPTIMEFINIKMKNLGVDKVIAELCR